MRAPLTAIFAILALACASLLLLLSGGSYAATPGSEEGSLFVFFFFLRAYLTQAAALSALTAALAFLLLERHHGSSSLFTRMQSSETCNVLLTAPALNKDVKLLTYNFFLRPLVKNKVSDYKELRLAYFMQHELPKFDIITFQEVFSTLNTRQRRLIHHAKTLGFHWKVIDGGLLVLSKYPIVETDHHLFRRGTQIDGWAAKQVLYAKILLTDRTFLHLFTTHAQSSYFENADNALNDSIRLEQMREIGEFMAKKIYGTGREEDRKAAVVLTGDLNVDARSHRKEGEEQETEQVTIGQWGEVDGESQEYKEMVQCFEEPLLAMEEIVEEDKEGEDGDSNGEKVSLRRTQLRDLLKESYGGIHPVTINDVIMPEGDDDQQQEGEEAEKTAVRDRVRGMMPRETVFTNECDYLARESKDYIFFFDERQDYGQEKGEKLVVDVKTTQVEPFFVDRSLVASSSSSPHFPCTQLSDHYGASAVLRVEPFFS
ncbi:sphingomyelin phosphodiesterase [Balamuthia mandrillaris]